MLVASDGARLLGHLLLEILVDLLERHDAVAIEIGRATQPLYQVVGEEAVAELGHLDGHLGGAGGRDDGAALGAREPIQEHLIHSYRPGAPRGEGAPARRSAVARVKEYHYAI